MNEEPDGFDCLRDKFLGAYHTEDNPAAECRLGRGGQGNGIF